MQQEGRQSQAETPATGSPIDLSNLKGGKGRQAETQARETENIQHERRQGKQAENSRDTSRGRSLQHEGKQWEKVETSANRNPASPSDTKGVKGSLTSHGNPAVQHENIQRRVGMPASANPEDPSNKGDKRRHKPRETRQTHPT